MTQSENQGPRERSWPGRILNALAEIIVAIYVILDSIFRTLFRPISKWLADLRIIARMEEYIAGLPAYVVLVLLIVPFAVAEPAKIYAIYLISSDHLMIGVLLLIAAYFVSVLVVDRIFHAGKAKLLSIPWFAKLWGWISAYKDRLLTWMKSTAAWKRIGEMKQHMREWASKLRKRFA